MEHWPASAVGWINENRDWLFSGAGLVVLSTIWAVLRFAGSRRSNASQAKAQSVASASGNSFGDAKGGSGEKLKPLMVHTTDGYLAQVGVLFEWRIVDPISFMKNLGGMEEASDKISARLMYHLIDGLEEKALSQIREERSALSEQLLQSFRDEIQPFGVDLVHLKIGRITPVDRHA